MLVGLAVGISVVACSSEKDTWRISGIVTGEVTAAHPGRVALRTALGTRRVLDMPVGELLPRIC